MRLGIGLGSNVGNREQHLREAIVRLLTLHEPHGTFLLSSFHETEPVDCAPGSPCFLNAVVEMECSLPAEHVLDCLQNWEVEMGRPADHGFHTPRTIDLDMLYYGELRIDSPRLRLPHPELARRDFVRLPLLEIRPDFFAQF